MKPLLLFVLGFFYAFESSRSFTAEPSFSSSPPRQQPIVPTQPLDQRSSPSSSATTHNNNIDNYNQAFSIIDNSAIAGGEPSSSEELYNAVRFIEKNSYKLYASAASQQELWNKAQGSWKLQLSTGNPKKHKSFHKPPAFLPFSFAMIDDTTKKFGNGIGWNENGPIWLSLMHNLHWYGRHRRMVVCLCDVYLFGHCITDYLPPFLREEALGKTPQDYYKANHDKKKEKQQSSSGPPPTFVLVGCSDVALVARGNQSGGLAIWTRLPHNIQPVAYKKKRE